MAADVLLLGLALDAAGRPWLVVPLGVAALVAVAAYRAQPRLALAALVALLFLLPQALLILVRGADAPVQDSVLLTDAAAGRLLQGIDPYGHDYIDAAALRRFWAPEIPVNPLLAHYPYPPGLILLAAPLHAAGLGAAWLWLPAFAALGLAAYLAAGRAGVVAVTLNPLLLLDYLSLLSDVFFLAAALAAVGLLRRRRALAAGLLVGVALALKQAAVVLLPALALLAWRERRLLQVAAAAAAALMVLVLPFLLWSPGAFVTDTATYFYGSGVDAFPIRGPGLPGLLLTAGVIPSRWAAFPSALLQAPVLALVLLAGGLGLRRRFSWPALWLWSAAVALVLFFLGRTLAPNYLTLIAVLATLAAASAVEDLDPGVPAVGRAVDRSPSDAGVEGVPG
ncbi:MAG TPA: hypothetical protein VIO84_10645 [Candidatus Dormibacteraeota bacterium]